MSSANSSSLNNEASRTHDANEIQFVGDPQLANLVSNNIGSVHVYSGPPTSFVAPVAAPVANMGHVEVQQQEQVSGDVSTALPLPSAQASRKRSREQAVAETSASTTTAPVRKSRRKAFVRKTNPAANGEGSDEEDPDLDYESAGTAKAKNQRPTDSENPEKTCLWGKDQGENCSFVAVNDLHLYIHIEDDHIGPSKNKVRKCLQPGCKYEKDKRDHIVSHQVTHCKQQLPHNGELNLFPCHEGDCTKVCTRKSDLKKHVFNRHGRVLGSNEASYRDGFSQRKMARAEGFQFGSLRAEANAQESAASAEAAAAEVSEIEAFTASSGDKD